MADPAALRTRQPWWLRVLMSTRILSDEFPVMIFERLLPVSLERLEEMMRPYLDRAHGESWVPDAD